MTSGTPPRVSIGLPVFNGERYLARAIDSVLGQDFWDFELIICDNASTDRFRREALLGSSLHGTHSGSDRVLLAEMALRGPWTAVAEPLFLHREHEGRYTRAVLLQDRRQAALWQDSTVQQDGGGAAKRSKAKAPSTLFHLVIYRKYLHLVRKNVRSPGARMACYWQLARWWTTDGHLPDVLRDLLGSYPSVRQRARSVKRLLLGARDDAPPQPGSLPNLK